MFFFILGLFPFGGVFFMLREGECFYAEAFGVLQRYAFGLPTKHVPVVKEITRDRLTHYFWLALPLSHFREPWSQRIPCIGRGREERKNPISSSSSMDLPRNKRNPKVMSKTVPSISIPHHLSDSVVRRELSCACIRLLSNLIPPFTRRKGMICVVQNFVSRYSVRVSCLTRYCTGISENLNAGLETK